MRMLCAAVRCSLFRLFPVRMANDKKCDDPDRKADEQILHGSVLLSAVHCFSRLAVSSRLSRSPVGVAARPPSAVSRNSTGHTPPDLAHRVDDLIDGDAALNARERHIRRAHGVDRADDVALDAGHLDQSRRRGRRQDP